MWSIGGKCVGSLQVVQPLVIRRQWGWMDTENTRTLPTLGYVVVASTESRSRDRARTTRNRQAHQAEVVNGFSAATV